MTEIRIPYQDEGDQILDAIDAARKTLDGDELRVTEQLVWHALERGTTRVGDFLEELETTGPAGRRQLVDRARASLGMKTVGEEEADKNFEEANRGLPPGRDPEGKIFQGCHAPDCHIYPLSEMGVPVPSAARRWFCAQHEHLAEPGDLDPPDDLHPRLDLRTMKLLPSRAEEAREAKEYEDRVRAIRERDKVKAAEAERLAKLEREWQEKNPPVLFGGPPAKFWQ